MEVILVTYVIIISAIINLLISIITRRNLFEVNELQCGIWGYMGPNARHFNKYKFNLLGILNDARGGDASGYLAGKHVRHIEASYAKLIQDVVLPTPGHNIVLGHTRKASSGGKFIQYAQPFCYIENEKIIGGAIHNGTLYNENLLQKKYKVPEKFQYLDKSYKPNDTQILSYILIKHKNFDVLKDYRGSAALAWEDRDTGLGYIFRGESRKFNYTNADLSDERPLFIYKTEKNRGIWISSLEDSLWMVAEDKIPDIQEVKTNTIIVIKDGEIIEEISVDRSENTQAKDYTTNNTYNTNYGSEYNNEYAYNHNKNKHKNGSKNNQLAIPQFTKVLESKIGTPVYQFAKEVDSLKSYGGCIQFATGRYYEIDDDDKKKIKLAHGVIHLDSVGYTLNTSNSSDEDILPYYFIEGVMYADHSSYQKTCRIIKRVKKGKYVPKNCTTKTSKDIKKLTAMMENSVYPLTNIKDDNLVTSWLLNDEVKLFQGDLRPLFTNKSYKFNKGIITEISEDSYRYPDHMELIQQKKEFKKKVGNKITLIIGEYYKLKGEDTVIQFQDDDLFYGTTCSGLVIYVKSDDDWVKTTKNQYFSEDTTELIGETLDENEKAWYEEIYTESATKRFDEVLKLLDTIESEAMSESIKSSKTVQKLVDSLRVEITNSELNII